MVFLDTNLERIILKVLYILLYLIGRNIYFLDTKVIKKMEIILMNNRVFVNVMNFFDSIHYVKVEIKKKNHFTENSKVTFCVFRNRD